MYQYQKTKRYDFTKIKKNWLLSKGDDYQVLFTASKKARIIERTSKSLGIKISKIGKICSSNQKSQIIDEKAIKLTLEIKAISTNFKS